MTGSLSADTAGNPMLRRKRTIMRNPTARITYPPNTPFPNTPFVAYRTAYAAVTARNHVALHSRSTQSPRFTHSRNTIK